MNPQHHPEPADLIATAKAEAARLHDQQAAVKTTEYRLGTALYQIKKDKLFVLAGHATFAAFVVELGLKTKDADWYIATRNIPAEFLAGRPIATGKLALISDAPAWLRAPLCAAVDTETGKKALRDAIREARKVYKRGRASTAEAIAAALRVLAEDRQKQSQGDKTGAERARGVKRQMTGLLKELVRLRDADAETDEALTELEPLGQELADALVELGLAQPETKTVTKVVTKIFTKVVAVSGAAAGVKNVKHEGASPLTGAAKPPGGEQRHTPRAESSDSGFRLRGTRTPPQPPRGAAFEAVSTAARRKARCRATGNRCEDKDGEDDGENNGDDDIDDDDDIDKDDDIDDGGEDDAAAADQPKAKNPPPPVPPPPWASPPPPPPPAYAPWPPPPPTCVADEMVKTEAQAADQDVPPNPTALEALRQVPTLTFEGQTYTLEQLGFAFEACFDDYHQQLLCEGLVFLIGAHDHVDWYELGTLRLRNMARMAEQDGNAGGLPLGLLPAWAELCAQSDLTARFRYAYHSLLAFRLSDCRRFIYCLAGYRAQQPFRTLYAEGLRKVELTRQRYWMLFAPDALTAVHREAQRLHDTTGIEYLTALKQAEATIVAERRARGLRE